MIPRAIILCVLLSVASHSQTLRVSLDSPYEFKVGDYVAVLLQDLFRAACPDLDVPMVSAYKPELKKIDLQIFGRCMNTEAAREAMENYLSFIHSTFIPCTNRRLGVSLTDEDFRLFYYGRMDYHPPKLILQHIGGQFIVPKG